MTAQPVGSTSPGHWPAAMAPPVSRTSPRPAGRPPVARPAARPRGSPSTVWPRIGVDQQVAALLHPRQQGGPGGGRQAGQLVGGGADGAHRPQAGRGLGQLGRADGGEAGGAGVDGEGSRPGHAPPAEGARQQPHQLLAGRALQDAARRRRCRSTRPGAGPGRRRPRRSGTTADAGTTTRNSLVLPPGISTGMPTGVASPATTSSRPRRSRSAVTCTRTATGRPGT